MGFGGNEVRSLVALYMHACIGLPRERKIVSMYKNTTPHPSHWFSRESIVYGTWDISSLTTQIRTVVHHTIFNNLSFFQIDPETKLEQRQDMA